MAVGSTKGYNNRDDLFSLILKEIDTSIDSIAFEELNHRTMRMFEQLMRSVTVLREDLIRMNASQSHIEQVDKRIQRLQEYMNRDGEMGEDAPDVSNAIRMYKECSDMIDEALSKKQ